ncbi:hypothetical protein SAMN04488515_2606 [Cognatiyoonia koreensis]|uniref:Uncharacterized protein n=1 Tax=Cognatiyoonia koreensis TaxID=364200 RepID=A0A1I0RFQ2_9RHOB|nr:DUF6478 family protein [Cognatiyoonia koreensis]SEW39511.1 hypothetical protein SAMN04488515_2606 [Cognatiyoonia koreensis]
MASSKFGMLDRLLHRREIARWSKAARQANDAELETLRLQRQHARQLRGKLEHLIHVADSRLALPRIGSNAFSRPGGTLWSWRPQLWRGPLGQRGLAAAASKTPLGEEVVLYHDCKISELTLRQVRNLREEDLAPFGLQMDVFRFDGSFLSLVLEMPKKAVDGLQRRHLIQLRTILETEKAIEVFARLNIKHGPNTEQIVLELPVDKDEIVVEFDLAYSDLNEKRVEKMWVDLIFEGPEMNQIMIRDITFCRYPRAEL